MSHQHHHECCEHHHHHHHHEHQSSNFKGQSFQLWKIGITIVLLIAAVITEKTMSLPTWQLLLVYLVPYLIIGTDTLKEAAEGLLHGDAFNEHFLMSVATIGALCIGFLPGAETEFPEAVFVMLFFQIGELFEGYAEGKSRESIAHLMDIRPDVARVSRKDKEGVLQEVTVRPDEVEVGEAIVIRPGEKVPLDGVIVSGTSSLNTMALTGESMPREVAEGDEVVSGCINLSGVLNVRTTKTFGESTVSIIIKLVEDASEHKSQSEAFITKFARIYTPIVVFAAIALAIIPPCISFSIYHLSFTEAFPTWLYRALMFLVVSCPCALVISVPLTFFGGIGGASRNGILIKGANYMDTLAKVGTVVFDKTGTLTHGEFEVSAVHSDSCESELTDDSILQTTNLNLQASNLLHLAAHVERYSTHPIAVSLKNAYPNEQDGCTIEYVEEVAGQGIRARVNGDVVCVGNAKMMDAVGVQWRECHKPCTTVHVAIAPQSSNVKLQNSNVKPQNSNFKYAGHIVIADKIKADAREAVSQLKQLGVGHIVMLTGDSRQVSEAVARELGIDEFYAELLPADKVAHIESLTPPLAFVGDGINDAPVLARADVGIAMGALGSDAAIEAADVVLMDDHPSKIAAAIAIARRTLAIARQNIWFAIGVKVAVLILATFGLATMWMAVFADVGVTVIAVLNAMRTLHTTHAMAHSHP